jgi:methionine--tRNA ligase beta chain
MKLLAAISLLAAAQVCTAFVGVVPLFGSTTTTTTTTSARGAVSNHPLSFQQRQLTQDKFSLCMSTDATEEEAKVTEATNGAPAAKKEKKKKTPPAASDAGGAIDISKLDIRVGVIQKAWEHPEADKLYCEEIDLGEEGGPRQIASGLKAHYSNVEDLEGRKVLVLANLKVRKLLGFPSHGMVLCAASEDGSEVKFVDPPEGAEVGERVFVEGYGGEPASENQVIKKKMLDAIFPELKTNGDGVATYKGVPLSTSAGVCKSSLSNVPIG